MSVEIDEKGFQKALDAFMSAGYYYDGDDAPYQVMATLKASLRATALQSGVSEAVEMERKRCDDIVCREWQSFARTKGVSAEALVAVILNAIRARSDAGEAGE